MVSPFIPAPFMYGDIAGGGQLAVIIVAQIAPPISQNQPVGTFWLNSATGNLYYVSEYLLGVPQWEILGTATGDVTNLSDTSGTTTNPINGIIQLSGTTNQITVTSGTNKLTFALSGPYTPTTYTTHGVLIGRAASSIVATATGSTGQVFQSGGATADPTWSTATLPSIATGTGTILRADGTNWAASTATYPNTTTANQILYSSSTSVVGEITTANSGVLSTNGSGAPSFAIAAAYTPAFSLSTAGDSAWTYSTQLGRFVQVGSLVYFIADLIWSGFSNSTGTGTWRVSLPVISGVFALTGQVQINGSGIDASAETASLPANFYGKIGSGASVVTLSVNEGGVGNATSSSFDLTFAQVKTTGSLTISGFYFAA